jgi:hypothetical protein
MDEIKAVRVRRNDINSGTLDIRVAIFKQNRTFGPDERVVVGVYNPLKPDGKKVWMETTYKKTGPYKDYTDDQFINEFINMNSKIEGKSYYIIQDPWENKVPIYRNYGSDPYYLNNGAVVYIMWKDGTKDVGGQKYSDDSGHELTPTDISFKKTIKINSSSETQGFTLGKNGDFEYSNNSQEYVSTIKDRDIISEIISKWKIKVDNYDLGICLPINESCSIIPYKGPLQPIVPDVPATPIGATAISADSKKKEPIKINLQDEKVKVKEDVLSLKVYIGIAKDSPLEPSLEQETLNTEQDDFVDGEGVDSSEYEENEFVGAEEQIIQLNAIDDAPAGPGFDEELAKEVDSTSTPRGSAPVKGSKLTNKSGTSMINLAGHRLTPLLKDLENFLNKNGYPGTKIGNNGVMRDLRSSAYPSSPARATASLHGAGLAIDVTFNIPGFKWSSIGDNANLASDSKLTKTIAAFIKGQSDLTWGASWGSGSNPAAGSVYKRGITEYHHFEIRADLIPSYWEPVKDELAKFGFKPTDLTSPGKGKGLHRLMLRLLGDSA